MRHIAPALCLLLASYAATAQTLPPGQAPPGGTAVGGAPGAPPPSPPIPPTPYDFNDHPGWTSMFDGATLNNWDGPMDSWRVENGTITSSQSAANPQGSVYLYWKGGEVRDFEFKTQIKLEGEGANSGIQFRADRLGPTDKRNSEWESRGYQADYTYNGGAAGSLIECCRGPGRGVPPRPGVSARAGSMIRTPLVEGEAQTILASLGDPETIKSDFRIGDWNEIHLIARGRVLMYLLNGRLMSVVVDDSPTMFNDRGELAIQLEGRGDTKVMFRELWIKPLD